MPARLVGRTSSPLPTGSLQAAAEPDEERVDPRAAEKKARADELWAKLNGAARTQSTQRRESFQAHSSLLHPGCAQPARHQAPPGPRASSAPSWPVRTSRRRRRRPSRCDFPQRRGPSFALSLQLRCSCATAAAPCSGSSSVSVPIRTSCAHVASPAQSWMASLNALSARRDPASTSSVKQAAAEALQKVTNATALVVRITLLRARGARVYPLQRPWMDRLVR